MGKPKKKQTDRKWFATFNDAAEAFNGIGLCDLLFDVIPSPKEQRMAYRYNLIKFRHAMKPELIAKYKYNILICKKQINGTHDAFCEAETKRHAADARVILGFVNTPHQRVCRKCKVEFTQKGCVGSCPHCGCPAGVSINPAREDTKDYQTTIRFINDQEKATVE